MKFGRIWVVAALLMTMPHRVGPGKTQNHHRSGRRRTGRNRPAIHPPADPVSANRRPRRHRRYRRRLAQIRGGAHSAHARTHRSNRYSGRGRGRISAGPPKGRDRTLAAALRLHSPGWAPGLRGFIIRPTSWGICRKASPPPRRSMKTRPIFCCAWSANFLMR